MRRGVIGGTVAVFTALFLSAAASGTGNTGACAPNGVCVTIADTDGVSLSNALFDRYMTYTVTARNATGSTLRNVAVRMPLVDLVGEGTQATTAQWVRTFLPQNCASSAPGEITCVIAELPPGGAVRFGPLPVRTSQTPDARATRLSVSASFGDAGAAQAMHPAPPAGTSEDTIYEQDPDLSASFVFAGVSTALNTDPGTQSSLFPINVPSGFEGFRPTSLREFDPSEPGYFCPVERPCFGQSVRTTAPGIFSRLHPAEVLAVVKRDLLPHGKDPKQIVVSHRRDDGKLVHIRATCSGLIGKAPPPEQLPCRRVFVDPWKHVVVIDVWDVDQGDWGFS